MTPSSRRPPKRARPAPRAAKKPAPRQDAKAPPGRLGGARRRAVKPPAEPPQAAPPSSGAAVEVEPTRPGRLLPLEVDPRRVEEALAKLAGEFKHWANKGRYTRVRFKFGGRQLLPDLPLAAVVAAEGLTFYWGGVLRALLVNVAGTSLLSVELVNDSEKQVQAGREALLAGELEAALGHFRAALEMQRDSASAHLHLGVALKLKGDFEGAGKALHEARALDPEGGTGAEAERLLGTLPPSASAPHFATRTDGQKR